MIWSYFDDSGTHPGSDVVLMAGVFGFPNQWDYLSEQWAKQLANPCPGKLPLTRFHMAECQASRGEFAGWKRTETDYLVHELGTIILNSGIYGFGAGIPRKAYDRLITGERRRSTGDAETMCLINCFVKIVRFSGALAPGHEVAIMFDNRPEKKDDIQKIYDVYNTGAREHDADIVTVAFGNSKKVLPLQVADMFAWETYQDSLDSLAGRTEAEGPRRPQLRRLITAGRLRVEYCSEAAVEALAAFPVDPDLLSSIANHVDFK